MSLRAHHHRKDAHDPAVSRKFATPSTLFPHRGANISPVAVAIKDDDKLVDEVIQRVYEQMIAYDHARFEAVMQLTIRRNASAGCAFRALLEDAAPARLNTNV